MTNGAHNFKKECFLCKSCPISRHLNGFLKYPENPILIAVDKQGLYFIQRLQGACLVFFCSHHDLSFCFLREIWVLYASQVHFNAAIQLTHVLQEIGASKIFVLHVQI